MAKIIDIDALTRYHENLYNDLNNIFANVNNKLEYTNVAYGTCSTSAGTAAKVVNLDITNSGWKLNIGSVIIVKFSSTNTASNPTLNVNGTGAKSVYFNTSKITSSYVNRAGYANRVIKYVYDGTYWVFMGWNYHVDYSTMSSSEASAGTSTSGRLITPKLLNDTINSAISEAIDTTGDGTKFLSDDGTYKEIASESVEITQEDIINLGFSTKEEIVDEVVVKPIHNGTDNTTITILPNVFYIWDTVEQLDITLGDEIADIYNEFSFQFASGETATTLILPANIKWVNDVPEIEPNMTYQCSIVNKIAIICGV